ncbi:hypothetical protein PRJ_3302 [Pseudomonas sp. XWY-1]|nr:hypothetical protein PRJ_3302 [Pseudomonas sp. XWY-1]
MFLLELSSIFLSAGRGLQGRNGQVRQELGDHRTFELARAALGSDDVESSSRIRKKIRDL